MQDFLRVFWRGRGRSFLLDNLIHMCLMLCTGNGAQTKLQRWAPETSLLLGTGISTICLLWRSEMRSQIRACIQAFQWVEELWWKQNSSSCHSPEQAWVCTLSEPVAGLAVREMNLSLSWERFVKCSFCGWFLVQVEEDLLLFQQPTPSSELWSAATQEAGRSVSPGC